MTSKAKPSKTRSWFEPNSSSKESNSNVLSSSNPGGSSANNLKGWHENPLQEPVVVSSNSVAPQIPGAKQAWNTNSLQNNTYHGHTFHFTSNQLPSDARRRKVSAPPPVSLGTSPSPSPSPAPSPSGVSPLPIYEDSFGVALGIFGRSLSKLSVSKDLPRFCSHIHIYKNRELILRPTNEEGAASHILDIKNFLHTLLTYLDPPELVKAFEENFSKFVTAELDIATRLQAFFNSGVLPQECNTFAVLRCIHQEIIFPVVMKLRQTVYEMFPYKDVKGSWNIYVVLVEDSKGNGVGKGISDVHVFHTKKEQSHDPNPCAHFEFEWAMALTLSPTFDTESSYSSSSSSSSTPPSSQTPAISINPPTEDTNTNKNTNTNTNTENSGITLQSLDFWVIDYKLDDGFDKNSKPLLVKLLQKFFHPDTATMCLWSKNDIFQVNVSRDFPRLAVKTTITDADKQVVLHSPAAVSDKEPALSVLMILVERLNPDIL